MIRGWDDAVTIQVRPASQPKHVTMIYPYYENPQFLKLQIDRWGQLPEKLRESLRAIIVDDGSPELRAEPVLRALYYERPQPFPIRLFRIDVDVPWNWLAARNVAMHHAAEGWCAATDMDHVFPRETLEALVQGEFNPHVIYRFSRKEHDGKVIHSHPNSWFMTRDMFWKFGGYDEALSGHYGTDGDARRRWVSTAKAVYTLPQYLVRYEYYGDSSTRRYQRKLPQDTSFVAASVKKRRHDWKPKVLSFPYREIRYDDGL